MRLVIFDMDGTLVDSVALLVETVTAALQALDHEVPDEKSIRAISGLNLRTGMQMLAPNADETQLAILEQTYRAEYTARVSQEMREPLFSGMRELLDNLAARDDMLLAIATGKALRGANRVLATHNIASLFSSVQTPDNNASKPHPGMIFSAMKVAGAEPSQTLMIGDTNYDMEMAVAGGVRAIGVDWGYHAVDELEAAGAHTIVEDCPALLNSINELLGSYHA